MQHQPQTSQVTLLSVAKTVGAAEVLPVWAPAESHEASASWLKQPALEWGRLMLGTRCGAAVGPPQDAAAVHRRLQSLGGMFRPAQGGKQVARPVAQRFSRISDPRRRPHACSALGERALQQVIASKAAQLCRLPRVRRCACTLRMVSELREGKGGGGGGAPADAHHEAATAGRGTSGSGPRSLWRTRCWLPRRGAPAAPPTRSPTAAPSRPASPGRGGGSRSVPGCRGPNVTAR